MNTIGLYALPSFVFPVLHQLLQYIKHRNNILTLFR